MHLTLTNRTAPTARRFIPENVPLPAAPLSPSRTAAALIRCQGREQLLIDATLHHLRAHLTTIADFATRVERLDEDVSQALIATRGRALP